MLRKIIALMIVAYAIAFAFGALAVVRMPSVMMVITVFLHDDLGQGLAKVNWREIGIAHGGPYLLASLCFYASATMVSARRHGGVVWYILGLAAGLPCLFLVSFEPGWWQDPSVAEGGIAGGALGALLLLGAVYELRKRRPRPLAPMELTHAIAAPVATAAPAPAAPVRTKPVFVPAAIARQRESFAAHGRKMHARRGA